MQIKEARKLKRMSQEELAKSIGVSQSAIANYERGRRLPDAEMLQRLAAALDTTADALLGYSSSALILSAEEATIVQMYRSLPPDGREFVQRLINTTVTAYSAVQPAPADPDDAFRVPSRPEDARDDNDDFRA